MNNGLSFCLFSRALNRNRRGQGPTHNDAGVQKDHPNRRTARSIPRHHPELYQSITGRFHQLRGVRVQFASSGRQHDVICSPLSHTPFLWLSPHSPYAVQQASTIDTPNPAHQIQLTICNRNFDNLDV